MLWTWIRIRIFSGLTDQDPSLFARILIWTRIRILPLTRKKVIKTLNLQFFDFFYFLSLKTDVNVPHSKSNKQTKYGKKLFFCWHLVSHWRKKQYPDPEVSGTDLWIWIRIHNKCHGSTALILRFQQRFLIRSVISSFQKVTIRLWFIHWLP